MVTSGRSTPDLSASAPLALCLMSTHDDAQRLAAEQRARVLIDKQLIAAGWVVQDKKGLNLFAAQGVAVRESAMAAGHGRADYLLYVDKSAVGVIEAKPEGTPLSGVEWQSAMYAEGLPAEVRLKALTVGGRLPFVFEASGTETHFTNGYDPEPRARKVFAFPKPSTFARILRDAEANPQVYDLRTNQHFTLKQNPLRRHHLDDFVASYLPGKHRSERWAFVALVRRSWASLNGFQGRVGRGSRILMRLPSRLRYRMSVDGLLFMAMCATAALSSSSSS